MIRLNIKLKYTKLTSYFFASICLCLTTAELSADNNIYTKSVQEANRAIQSLQANSTGFVSISRQSKTPYIEFLRADPASPIVDISISRAPSDRAKSFLQSQKTALVNSALPLELETSKVTRSQGVDIVRLQQLYRGLVVRGGEAVIQMNSKGITALNSKLHSGLDGLDIIPAVSEQDALTVAIKTIATLYNVNNATFSPPTLEIFDEGALLGNPGISQLAWFIEASGALVREYIWIDARNGTLITNFSQIAHAHIANSKRTTVDAINAKPVPPNVCNFSDVVNSSIFRLEGSGTTGNTELDTAHDMVGIVFDFYKTILGRHGQLNIDGTSNLASIVNVCDMLSPIFDQPAGLTLELAGWDGTRMFFATDYVVDDLVGHEYTHTIIDQTANFNLIGESGALAESFADIIGETVDLVTRPLNDNPVERWNIGEDAPPFAAFRNLLDPAMNGFPDKMTDKAAYYCRDSSGFINQDVFIHSNSSVLSHAFALLADGTGAGTFNSVKIDAIGEIKAVQIFYEGLLLLTPTSQFNDASNALRAAADTMVTAGTITTNEKTALNNALDAVELNIASPCKDKAIAYCPTGQAPQFIFKDDFENPNSGNWFSAVGAIGTTNHWGGGTGTAPADIYHTLQPGNGSFSLYADMKNAGEQGDSSVEMTNTVMLPVSGNDIRMQFEHNFQFDTSEFHGGVVEYKIAGGAWTDAGTLMTQGGYNGIILNTSVDFLDRSGFVNSQFDNGDNPPFSNYGSTQLNLATIAGQEIQFRFRVVRDNFAGPRGWLIDDYVIYTCQTQAFVTTPTAGLRTNEAGDFANFDISLASQPQGPVQISISSDDLSEGTVSPATITFIPSNWNVPKTIIITGVGDGLADGNINYNITISVTNSPAGSIYDTADDIVIPITNDDNDQVGATGANGGGGPMFPLLLILPFAYLYIRRYKLSK